MHNEHTSDRHIFGFWIYLMTDLLMFAAMFATFIVLRGNTFGGPSGADLFNLKFVFVETILLLTSSFTMGLAMVAAHRNQVKKTIASLAATFVLGAVFIGMELYEFSRLAAEGHTWAASAFLSGFFSLVGMHGIHIAFGLLWIAILLIFLMRKGLTPRNLERLTLLSLFWHFLDLVWIFIFTIVYLMGVL
jgi:cytochrome o ubiquinol oxidase subunit 3